MNRSERKNAIRRKSRHKKGLIILFLTLAAYPTSFFFHFHQLCQLINAMLCFSFALPEIQRNTLLNNYTKPINQILWSVVAALILLLPDNDKNNVLPVWSFTVLYAFFLSMTHLYKLVHKVYPCWDTNNKYMSYDITVDRRKMQSDWNWTIAYILIVFGGTMVYLYRDTFF